MSYNLFIGMTKSYYCIPIWVYSSEAIILYTYNPPSKILIFILKIKIFEIFFASCTIFFQNNTFSPCKGIYRSFI